MNRFTVNNNNNSMEKLGEELSAAVALTTLGVPSHSNLIRHQQVQLPHHAPLSYMAMHQHQQQQHLSMISRKKTKTDNTRRNFAQKLFDVLESPYHTDVVKWLPGGKAFIVLDKRRFANEILPSYFKESQYTSFTRKLSRWKFTRVSRGPYMGAYYHKNFRRENRLMCKLMSCNNSKKSSDDDNDASVAPETAEDNDQIEADLVSTTPPPPPQETRRLPSNAPSQSDGTLEQAMSLQHTMHNTDNNILLIKQQIMEIRLRKARVEKRKQFLLMQAEAEARRLKEIQNIKNAMNMRIQQAENRIIAAAARALNRSNDINQTIMRNEILSYSPSWPPQEITTALPQTPQRRQHIDDTVLSPPETTSTSANLLSSRAFAA